MPRLVQHNSRSPKQVGNPQDNLWICRCGLAKTQPFCDGSHKLTIDESEEKLYQYDANLQKKELTEKPGAYSPFPI